MTATENAGIGTGSRGFPQTGLDEHNYSDKVSENENSPPAPPKYAPTDKHGPGGYGSKNPIKSQDEGQKLLETGYKDGKQVYNITDNGKIVKFQPDNTPNNGYHAYQVTSPRDIPNAILKQMLSDGKISQGDYNKFRKGKKQ